VRLDEKQNITAVVLTSNTSLGSSGRDLTVPKEIGAALSGFKGKVTKEMLANIKQAAETARR